MTNPKPCAYDRNIGYRATIGEHDDDCTDPAGHRGCSPCTAGHCTVCSRNHTSNQNPQTCPDCVGSVREDLHEIGELCRQLRRQAVDAEGLSWASSRIPGAAAMVAMSPAVPVDQVRMSREYHRDHFRPDGRPIDPIPPLAILARWEETWASWLGQDRSGRTTVTRAAGYLDRQLTLLAQQTPTFRNGQLVAPPEFGEFATALGKLRASLERILHDEEFGEHGVDCFECGARLVRRIRDPKRCKHKTPAREVLAEHLRRRPDAQVELAELTASIRATGRYRPYAGAEADRYADLEAASRLPSPVMMAAAKLPCRACDQGGVADPRPGISWECPACRKKYTPGEYATAVRRDLLDRNDGDGWTEILLAADAASTLVGYPITALVVRRWMDRNKIGACCLWTFDHLSACKDPAHHDGCRLVGRLTGQRLVYWPDVADEAVASLARAKAAAAAREAKRLRDLEEDAHDDDDPTTIVETPVDQKADLGDVPADERIGA